MTSSAAWRSRLDALDKVALAKASPLAYKVFRAIVRHAGMDGYAWPKIATIQAETGIGKRDTVYPKIAELERLGVLSHRQLVHRQTGRVAGSLYRVGAKVECVPGRCRMNVVLAFKSRTSTRRKARPCPPGRGMDHAPSGGAARSPVGGGTVVVPPEGATGTLLVKENPSMGNEVAVTGVCGSVSVGAFGVEGEKPKTENTDFHLPDQDKTEPRSPTGARVEDPVEPETHGEKTDRFLESTCRAFPGLPSQFVELAFSRVYRQAGEWNSEPERAAYYITSIRKLFDDSVHMRKLCEEWRGAWVEFFIRRLGRDYVHDEQTLRTLHLRIAEMLPRSEPVDMDAAAADVFLREFRARFPVVTDGVGGPR